MQSLTNQSSCISIMINHLSIVICSWLYYLGEGFNQVFVDCDPSAHGEVVAIRNAGKNLGTHELKGCSLYTNFEPCAMCTAVIWWSRYVMAHFRQM